MQIPVAPQGANASRGVKRLIPTSLAAKIACGLCLGFLALVAAVIFGMKVAHTEFARKVDKVLELNAIDVGRNYLGSFGAAPEHLTIDIKHKHYVKLADWRRTALERDQITADLKNYVPATIRYKDQQMDAKVRLKGEWVDHVKTDKWSFRVQLKGDSRLFGMKRFSIQHPRTRSYLNEWFYQQALAREGIVALRYEFVSVTVNGRNLGVYALEEHFGKELIEHNQNREGVFVRFDAGLRYKPFSVDFGSHEVDISGLLDDMVATGIGSQSASQLVAYDEQRIAADETLQQQLRLALDLLEAFRHGDLQTHKVFDTDKLAVYFAVSELLGALWTADDWSDMRFVYNPITSRLEPVAVEGYDSVRPIETLLGAKYSGSEVPGTNFHSLLFRDPIFFAKYVAALEKVSHDEYLPALISDLAPRMKPQRKILHSEFPYKDLSRDVFERNAEVIRLALRPEKSLHAYLVKQEDRVCQLELGAIQLFPVEVLRLSSGDTVWVPEQKAILSGMRRLGRPEFQLRDFYATAPVGSEQLQQNGLQVHYRLYGSPIERSVDVILRPRQTNTLGDSDLPRIDGNVEEFPFLTIDVSRRTIVVAPGDWDVSTSVVLPPDYQILAGPGVHLNLGPQVNLLSYSPLRFSGTEEAPVVIASADGTGQGLVVLNAKNPSLLRHVVFKKLSTPKQGGWEVTGAVTFYRSPVELHNCEFLEMRSEDALNLVQSEFTIHEAFFYDTSSDAVDLDFCEGTISHCKFGRVGGDALDFSGSQVKLADVQVEQAGDKGISVGEGSELISERVSIRQARLGIAVKDLSAATMSDVSIADSTMGIAVFQKKPEYGPGRLQIEGLAMRGVEVRYIVEAKSLLRSDGKDLPATDTNVAQAIYGSPPDDQSPPLSPPSSRP